MKRKIEELFHLAMKVQEKTNAYVSFDISNYGEYVTIGRIFENEFLCRKRFEEKIKRGMIIPGIDLKSAVIARRRIMALVEEWEAFDSIDPRSWNGGKHGN